MFEHDCSHDSLFMRGGCMCHAPNCLPSALQPLPTIHSPFAMSLCRPHSPASDARLRSYHTYLLDRSRQIIYMLIGDQPGHLLPLVAGKSTSTAIQTSDSAFYPSALSELLQASLASPPHSSQTSANPTDLPKPQACASAEQLEMTPLHKSQPRQMESVIGVVRLCINHRRIHNPALLSATRSTGRSQ